MGTVRPGVFCRMSKISGRTFRHVKHRKVSSRASLDRQTGFLGSRLASWLAPRQRLHASPAPVVLPATSALLSVQKKRRDGTRSRRRLRHMRLHRSRWRQLMGGWFQYSGLLTLRHAQNLPPCPPAHLERFTQVAVPEWRGDVFITISFAQRIPSLKKQRPCDQNTRVRPRRLAWPLASPRLASHRLSSARPCSPRLASPHLASPCLAPCLPHLPSHPFPAPLLFPLDPTHPILSHPTIPHHIPPFPYHTTHTTHPAYILSYSKPSTRPISSHRPHPTQEVARKENSVIVQMLDHGDGGDVGITYFYCDFNGGI